MYRFKKKCPTVHVIPRILNVVNVVRHYLVMESYFPDTNLRDMRPRLVQQHMYNLHDLGRIVSSHARSAWKIDRSMVGPSSATHSCTSRVQ